jgi:catechol 2,3-dioxygenase-like lactoylglutathione lyase family enzyme
MAAGGEELGSGLGARRHAMTLHTKGFLHITIAVTDLERSTAFYRDVIGCEIVNQYPVDDPIMTFMKTGEDHFVLTKMDGGVSPNPPGDPDIDSTLFHHAFLVDEVDFERAIVDFKAAGIPYFLSDFKHGTFPGRRHVYIHDPDRNSVELATTLSADSHG